MRYGAANVTTFVILGFALWVLVTRIRNRPDNNWPMVFYPVLATFTAQIPGRIDFEVLTLGMVAALLLRFEFVGGAFVHFVRVVDFGVLSALAYYLYLATV